MLRCRLAGRTLAALEQALLAVDLGLSTGLALYGQDGRLRWYRSKHFGSTTRLRRGVRRMLADIPHLSRLVVEGSSPLANIWLREADRRHLTARQISAEDWRRVLLYPRQQRSGQQAKRTADEIARRIIDWSDAPRPTTLRHDTAEAILIGLWGVLEIGWLDKLPPEVR
jgi:hypothetical protein